MKGKMFALVAVFTVVPMVLAGCVQSSPSTSGGMTPTSGKPVYAGRIEVRVTDAPPKEEVEHVLVTVNSVEIHEAGANQEDESGWTPLNMKSTPPVEFDLLAIQGIEEVLADGKLAAGNYTQIRMEVTKVGILLKGHTQSEQPKEAKLPSGKLKFVQPFEVVADQTTVLLFDFDAMKSVNVTGNGQYMFKPVIKMMVTKTPGALEITTPSLPNGEKNESYTATTLTAMGGKTPYTWSIVSGSLPTGLNLDGGTGLINGTPTATGDFTFTAKVVDSSTIPKSATKGFTVDIADAGVLQIITTSLPDGAETVAYTATAQAVGGTKAYTWSISEGNLPPGLNLTAGTGEIAGTPTTKGDFSFTVKVTDSATPAQAIDTQNLTIHIAKAVSD